MGRTIQIIRHIEAPTEEVYLALTNPFTISLWTNEPAEMEAVPGSEFSMMEAILQGAICFSNHRKPFNNSGISTVKKKTQWLPSACSQKSQERRYM